MRLSSILVAIFAAMVVLASPMEQIEETTELSQTEAYELLDQFADMAQLSQSEALDLLEQYAQLEAEGQDVSEAVFLPVVGAAASVVLPYVAKKVLPVVGKAVLPIAGKLAKKVLPDAAGSFIDAVTGSGKSKSKKD